MMKITNCKLQITNLLTAFVFLLLYSNAFAQDSTKVTDMAADTSPAAAGIFYYVESSTDKSITWGTMASAMRDTVEANDYTPVGAWDYSGATLDYPADQLLEADILDNGLKYYNPKNVTVVMDDSDNNFTYPENGTADSLLFTWGKFWIMSRDYYVPVAAGSLMVPKTGLGTVYLDADIRVKTTSSLPADSVKFVAFTSASLNSRYALTLFSIRTGSVSTNFSDISSDNITTNQILNSTIGNADLADGIITSEELYAGVAETFKQFNPRNQMLWTNSTTLWEWDADVGTTPDSCQLKWPIFWAGYEQRYTKFKADSFRVIKHTSQQIIYVDFDETAKDNAGTKGSDYFGVADVGGEGFQYDSNKVVIGAVYNGIFTPAWDVIRIQGGIPTAMLEDSLLIDDAELTPEKHNHQYIFEFNNVSANISKISTFLKNYVLKDGGSDSLLIIDIIGSSIFGSNATSLGQPDTSQNCPGTWTNLQGQLLYDSLQYSTSDLQYYTRSHDSLTFNGTWQDKYGQWSNEYTGGSKYKQSGGNAAYVELEIDSCTNFAIIYEGRTDGDTLVVTFNGYLPSVGSITGSDSIDTYVTAGDGEDYERHAHSYYSSLSYDSTYTVRFTKSALTSDTVKVWGFMKWSRASIHVVTNANSGSGGQVELDDLDENVHNLSPDLVIYQVHDVNKSPAGLNAYYDNLVETIDSLDAHSYQQLYVISNKIFAGDALQESLVKLSRLALANNNKGNIDIYALTVENNYTQAYFGRDGVHPNSTGVNHYVIELLKVLQLRVFGGM